MTKIENLFRRLRGYHPTKDIEPPLTGQALSKAISRVRSEKTAPIEKPSIIEARIYESGTVGTTATKEPYVIIQATLSDGRIIASYQHTYVPHEDAVREFAAGIPDDEWFAFDPNHPAESRI